ncbi:hypothetical protein NLJ89_g867 [Agrocybe chaxingu]|uniref:RNA helicase n=1 Tax=Agrocybe chaxingu TaxID=84603 RepID=A0A9W8TFD3_9AGAR|nr:hypothetical protein NLJ89_g867 [Agrocybe chaxingu]
MPSVKRKLSPTQVGSEDEGSSSPVASQDDGFDISSALIRKRPKITQDENDDEDLADFIQSSIAKRSIKEGTSVIKQAKGKAKVVKGEVGGGSFQSMGQCFYFTAPLDSHPAGYRPASITSAIPDISRLQNSNPDPALVNTSAAHHTAKGPCGRHSPTFGARALILLPTRELALQILKVGKELARGFHGSRGDHAGDKFEEDSKKGESLRWGLVVGGESLDEQFEMITSNPDVVIATPGRLLHLVVEMALDLKSIQYVVFDEADRLFEMGFEVALNEILGRLPTSRQTILFSATLPKSLVEFAKAGLQDPKLVRLDAESKISTDLRMAFFSVKQAEKDACLLALLRDVIKVPFGSTHTEIDEEGSKKKKGKFKHSDHFTAPHQTLIFAATKHHVEYLLQILTAAGYAVSHIYGSLDQTARTLQMDQFRRGVTTILVVTDVAARGLDIPVLENVINYDFPQGARVFVHRVGRTARAGRQGWAWSFVTNPELPYLLDLQLFLGRPLVNDVAEESDQVYTESLVLGNFQREKIDEDVEYIRSLDALHHQLPTLREVMKRGHAMYERSKGKASAQSYKRAKGMTKDPKWFLANSDSGIHPALFRGPSARARRESEEARKQLLCVVNSFTPSETVFETGSKASSETAALMKERRKALGKYAQRAISSTSVVGNDGSDEEAAPDMSATEMANEDEIVAVFGAADKARSSRDEEFYMSHYQKDAMSEKGYSLNDGASSFVKQAQNVTFDLTNDEGRAQRSNKLTWDKKKKKFIQGDGVGADNVKMVRTENGTRLPATFRSGRFDEWKSKSRTTLPRIGEAENASSSSKPSGSGRHRFQHHKIMPAKPLDKLDKGFERKARQLKKKLEESGAMQEGSKQSTPNGKLGVRHSGKTYGRVKTELKTSEQIRKNRKIMENRRAKNARPNRTAGKKGRR